ncbi:MAG: capsular biosynthesis protein [Cyclobacteriaceae bacterium]|nr:capsular biosynthesis protein [Cyclobacteriaceae bacterium]
MKTDLHSHLLPGIDDGSPDIETSLSLIRSLIDMGYEKLITTPHIMQDYYPNTPEIINKKLEELKSALQQEGIKVSLEAAAEYFLDEFLIEKLKQKEDLLLISNKYLLFEMSFMSESPYLKEFIFQARSAGLIPILAHVERYNYYIDNLEAIEDISERGALLQLNINSLTGYYSKPVQQLAEKMINRKLVNVLGTDCHHHNHLELIKKAKGMKYYEKAVTLPLVNYTL